MQTIQPLVDVDILLTIFDVLVVIAIMIIILEDGGYKRSEPSTISSQSLKIPWI